MTFWFFIALLTLLSLLSIGYPLFIRKSESIDGTSYDTSVYREQLNEIDREVERGQIASSEAELARAEIARRLIALDSPSNASEKTLNTPTLTIVVSTVVLLLVPVFSVATYLGLGKPGRQDMPLQARISADPKTQSIEELIARAEARVQNAPNDVRGWEVLAPVYMRLNRPKDAVRAYRNIIRLSGSQAKYEAALGEALTIVAGGVITSDAKTHFVIARKADPNDAKAEFFLAVALGQEGKYDQSILAWQALLAKSPTNAPWIGPAQQELQRVQKLAGNRTPPGNNAPSKPGGPTNEQVASAANMSAEDRTEMIAGMVAQLAEKLEEEPKNLPGWMRLIRSYGVLGRKDDAATAVKKAGMVFSNDPAATKKLADMAKAMNIEVKNP